MRKGFLIIALGMAITGTAVADVLSVPETESAAPAATPPPPLPAKGTSMSDVEKRFGAPTSRRAPVGGDRPKHPPITRWDYPNFLVMFEHDKVVDVVVPGAPPRIYNKDELTPVAGAPPPPEGPMQPQTPVQGLGAEPESPAPAEPSGMIPEAPADAPTAPYEATPQNPNPDAPPPPGV